MPNLGLDYKQANELVEKHITNNITRLHLIETEAIMRALAKRLGESEEEWGIVGLLHDIDWDLTKGNPAEHCVKMVEILKAAGASDYLIETIVSHGYGHPLNEDLKSKVRSTQIQHALAAAETLTGLVIASALVQPDKKLASVSLDSLKRKFKTEKFAQNCNRQIILECEKIGIGLDEFLQIGLSAFQAIASKLGL